jgi:integrase
VKALAVQHFLGHENASETLDTYGHLWADDEDRIRVATDAGFRNGEDRMKTAGAFGT